MAALIKQIPAFTEMELGADGRLRREGLELEMNPYCRRAVSQAVGLAADLPGSNSVTFLTLGPPSAEDVLREALAWALDREVSAEGVLITDPAFAGSDTLATARALAAALEREGPFDLVLAGRNSVDADTGQVGPQVAELLDLPFLTGARRIVVADGAVQVRCEHDDGWVEAEATLPAVVSTAERLIEPCKVEPSGRAAVPSVLLRALSASQLGPGPWGQSASPTTVGAMRAHEARRDRIVLEGSIEAQVRRAVELLMERGALVDDVCATDGCGTVPPPGVLVGPAVGVVVEPDRMHAARELLGAAARIAGAIDGHVVAITCADGDPRRLGTWGADSVIQLEGSCSEEDVAGATCEWAEDRSAWAVLVASTAWGREVASRCAARLGAGLTGDAVDLEVEGGRLVAWKSAFGGQLVVAITATSPVQLATVRVGVLPAPAPRDAVSPLVTRVEVTPRNRVRVRAGDRDDNLDVLAEARAVVGVGKGVDPSLYAELRPLVDQLDAELGATRKVTDNGWLPRARQIGITGRAIAPRLFVSIGSSGKFNHMVGVRAAGTILALNQDPDALVFQCADIGIVGDWRVVVPALTRELERVGAAWSRLTTTDQPARSSSI